MGNMMLAQHLETCLFGEKSLLFGGDVKMTQIRLKNTCLPCIIVNSYTVLYSSFSNTRRLKEGFYEKSNIL